MASLKEVKTRITSVMSTQQITKAMKMVAAAKLRRSQDRIIQMRPFAQKMASILQNLSSGNNDGDTWYSDARPPEKVLIVAITSDRGLAGSFNSNVFKGVNALIQEKYTSQLNKGNLTILPLGKKAADYFGKRKLPIIGEYVNIFQSISFTNVAAIGDYLIDVYRKGQYDRIEIVYNQFKNVATQIIMAEQWLPVVPVQTKTQTHQIDYIFQPNQEEIMTGLIPKSLKVQLYKAVLDSNASENGARMTAMDKANENAGELLKDLKLMYNRTRQAAITTEILEIVAGAEALKSA